jgi:hypothetical protein
MKLRTRWRFFWMSPGEWFGNKFNRFICRVFGHKKPYSKKLSCELCPRCYAIVRYTPVLTRLSVRKRIGGGEG